MECDYMKDVDDVLDTQIQVLSYYKEDDMAFVKFIYASGITSTFKTNDKLLIKQLDNISNELPLLLKILKNKNSYILVI